MKPETIKAMFSSKTDEWETPKELFDKLNKEFHFTLDVCATAENAKCHRYYTKEQNGLRRCWKGRAFMNPPYGREIVTWVQRAWLAVETMESECVVCLLPARPDTQWFKDYCWKAREIRFLTGRIKFGDSTQSAPFPSMIVIFKRPLAGVDGPKVSRLEIYTE